MVGLGYLGEAESTMPPSAGAIARSQPEESSG